MKRFKWVLCCAMVLFLSVPVDAHAQFGGGDPKSERAAAAEEQLQSAIDLTAELMVAPQPDSGATETPADFCQCVGGVGSESVATIEKALAGPLHKSGLEFQEQPLEEVVNVLQDDYGIPIQLDTPALDEIGIGADEPVTVNLRNISLESALRLMLKPLQLTYVIQDEVLIITTPEEAESQLIVCVYDVRDLIEKSNAAKRLAALVDTVVSCVSTETWAKNGGGEAEIRPLEPGLLVVSQAQAVHDEVRGLLETIRHMRGQRPAAAAAAAVPTTSDTDRVVTRFYLLQIGQAENVNELRAQVRDLITSSLPDERWNGRLEDGQPVVLAILPDRVVVRHKPSAQDEVRALLVDSGVAAPTPDSGSEMRGYGGAYGGGYGGRGFERGRGGGFFQPEPAEAQ